MEQTHDSPTALELYKGHPVQEAAQIILGSLLFSASMNWIILPHDTSRLIQAEAQALKNGQDLRHTLISNLDDPDNPSNQRISVTGVSFDDLTLADWEAAKLGQIEAPFTFEDFDVLDS